MGSSYLTTFSRTILTAVFAGFAATVVCLVYNIYFRESTGFYLSGFINVSSIIFIVNIVFLLIGLVYYALINSFKKGEIFFITFFVVLTAVSALLIKNIHRTDDQLLNMEFHHLLIAIVLVVGAFSAIGIPFLYHNRKFDEYVL
jgi:hypothetical protein